MAIKHGGEDNLKRLLPLLVCPLTREALVYDAENQELISNSAGLAFPIVDGIPVMLIDQAREMSEDDRDSSM